MYRPNDKMSAVIMAGGFGTRFATLTKQIAENHPELYGGVKDVPKPMAEIDGVPILEREIETLVKQGFTEIILTVSYLADVIIDYFGDGSGVSRATGKPFGCHITYYVEETPLGNAGALYKILDKISNHFLLLNADSLFDIDFKRIVHYHYEHDALATLFTHPNSHPYDSGLLVISTEKKGVVEQWLSKEDPRPQFYNNRVNAGLHVMTKQALLLAAELEYIEVDKIGLFGSNGKIIKVDLDRNILKPLVDYTDKVIAYDSPEYVKDMGTLERFEAVTADYVNGVVGKKNLQNKQRAIFLDRDGTINNYVGFLREIDQFELILGISKVIKYINSSGYLAIVITNQPVIARGEVSVDALELIHKKLETELGKDGAYIDGIFYCPHHPDLGFEGEVPELKFDCDCRKPKTGLIDRAVSNFNIDVQNSYFIGDSINDILCGKNAGVKGTILYAGPGANQNTSNEIGLAKPDYRVKSMDQLFNLMNDLLKND